MPPTDPPPQNYYVKNPHQHRTPGPPPVPGTKPTGCLLVVLLSLAGMLIAFMVYLLLHTQPRRHQAPHPAAIKAEAEPGLPRLSQGVYGLAAVADGEQIYLIDGSTARGYSGRVEAFDPGSETFQVITEALIPRRYLTAALVNGSLYVLGGVTEDREIEAATEILNLANGTVTYGLDMPTPRYFARAVPVGDSIYVIGGTQTGEDGLRRISGAVEIYDTATGSWRTGADMPTPRQTAAVLAQGQIYTIGGYQGGEEGIRAVEVYDPKTDSWEKRHDLPEILSAHSAVVVNQHILCFGNYLTMGQASRYDLGTGEWQRLDIPYQPSRHNASVLFDESVFVFGGNTATSGSYLDTIQVFPLSQLE